jgi:hypothetical protein
MGRVFHLKNEFTDFIVARNGTPGLLLAGFALANGPMPASWGWSPVMRAARVGQQRAEL